MPMGWLTNGGADLQVGDTAPDVTLVDVAGGEHVLDSLVKRGPVILLFFPKAFTSG